MYNNLKKYLTVSNLLILLLTGLGLFLFFRNDYLSSQVKEKDNLNLSLNDTLKVWKDKQGNQHASIRTIETDNPNDFIKLPTTDPQVQKLQKVVSENKNNLGKQGSVTVFNTKTIYDTIKPQTADTKTVLKGQTVMDSINNKYIYAVYGFKDNNSIFKLKVTNDYSVVIGEKSQGWFKPKVSFVDIINYNPYSETEAVRTYQVKDTRKNSKLHLGFYGGYGATLYKQQVLVGPQVGVGLTYNLK